LRCIPGNVKDDSHSPSLYRVSGKLLLEQFYTGIQVEAEASLLLARRSPCAYVSNQSENSPLLERRKIFRANQKNCREMSWGHRAKAFN